MAARVLGVVLVRVVGRPGLVVVTIGIVGRILVRRDATWLGSVGILTATDRLTAAKLFQELVEQVAHVSPSLVGPAR